MAVCSRCNGTGKVRGKKDTALVTHKTFYYDATCPKCGGTGQYNPPSGPKGTGYSEKKRSDGTTHHSLYRKDKDDHISWNSNQRGDFIPGSGHRDKDGRKKGGNW